MKDIELMVKAIAPVIREYLKEALSPIQIKLAGMQEQLDDYVTEKRFASDLEELQTKLNDIDTEIRARIDNLPVPANGKDGANGRDGIDGKDGANGTAGKDGVDGKDGRDGVDGKDGRDGIDGKDGINGEKGLDGTDGKDGVNGKDGRDGVDGKDGAAGLDGKDGADGLNGKDGVNGKDGRDGVDGKDGADGLNGKDGADGLNGKDGADGLNGKDGRDGVNGKDGISIVEAVIDQEGKLMLSLSDGKVLRPGIVKGLDGPVGKDGIDGKDGKDGLSFKDFEVVDNGDTFTFKAERDDHKKEWVLTKASMSDWYRGVWNKDGKYKRGDVVTCGGSLFLAKADTEVRPETNEEWQMIVKRGRDGLDGKAPPKEPAKVKL